MYRIYDKPEAIKRVQIYLGLVGNPDIFVAPTGVYDDNTKKSVRDFQRDKNIYDTGEVDKLTFDLLFHEYSILLEKNALKNAIDSFITFPLLPGQSADGMIHINKAMANLLDYYGYTHRLRESNFYSSETADAVKLLRQIYMLENKEFIDEIFYLRMTKDHNSINKF